MVEMEKKRKEKKDRKKKRAICDFEGLEHFFLSPPEILITREKGRGGKREEKMKKSRNQGEVRNGVPDFISLFFKRVLVLWVWNESNHSDVGQNNFQVQNNF